MLPINRITNSFSLLWRNMPVGTTPLCLTGLSLAIGTRFTSDRRIRAAIIVTGGLWFIAQKIIASKKETFKIEDMPEPPPQQPAE